VWVRCGLEERLRTGRCAEHEDFVNFMVVNPSKGAVTATLYRLMHVSLQFWYTGLMLYCWMLRLELYVPVGLVSGFGLTHGGSELLLWVLLWCMWSQLSQSHSSLLRIDVGMEETGTMAAIWKTSWCSWCCHRSSNHRESRLACTRNLLFFLMKRLRHGISQLCGGILEAQIC